MVRVAFVLMTLLACSEPVVCPKLECAAPPACPAVKQFDATTIQNAGARFAVQMLQNLLDDKQELVRDTFTPELKAELAGPKLTSIVNGLIAAHGPPTQIVDAWTSEIKEKEEVMPAAQVLIHMTNGVRVSLLLVFAPNGAVKGLWLRPI